MHVGISSDDHRGFALKAEIGLMLGGAGHEVLGSGAHWEPNG